MIKGTFRGVEKTIKAFKKLESEVMGGQIAAVREATLMIHGEAVKLLQDNTDGESQVRYGPKRTVNVSAPGTPPNTDRGRAVQSIKFDFQKEGLVGRVGTNLKYLADFELTGNAKKRRPWLSRAVEITSSKIADIFKANLRKAVKASKK